MLRTPESNVVGVDISRPRGVYCFDARAVQWKDAHWKDKRRTSDSSSQSRSLAEAMSSYFCRAIVVPGPHAARVHSACAAGEFALTEWK